MVMFFFKTVVFLQLKPQKCFSFPNSMHLFDFRTIFRNKTRKYAICFDYFSVQ